MALTGCVQCGKNIHDFVLIPCSPEPQQNPVHANAPPTSYEKDSKAWEFTNQTKDTKKLCERCNQLISSRLDDLIKEAASEHAEYTEFITDLHYYLKAPPPSNEEQNIMEELSEVLDLRARVDAELSTLRHNKQTIRYEEEKHWLEINALSKQLSSLDLHARDWGSTYEEIIVELDRLGDSTKHTATNKVYADAFQISVLQGIGVINNLRLGRLSDIVVEWDEINAAWGQAALLLYTLAKKLSFSFTLYKITPVGFRPTIQNKATRAHYPLYGSNAITFGRSFFWGTNNSTELDFGMEAFLFCVSELCARVLSLSSTITLPYYIDKDKIGAGKRSLKSIWISANSEVDWSKALKYMLTNLKRILIALPTLMHESGNGPALPTSS